jgi:two-component sensor histidine kinase/FixJ family two-component response regulator
MSVPLRALIAEDSEDDTLLVMRQLKKGGYDPIFERVDAPEAFTAALARQSWDVIIADYSMPHFSGLKALTLLKDSGHDLPFIIVSGAIGEDVAVSAMKAGAHDYVMKNNLARLVPAVQRELQEAEARQARRQAEQALHKAKDELEIRVAERTADLALRNSQLLALQAASTAIASSLDLQNVLETVTREMAKLLQVDFCVICMWDQDRDTVFTLYEHSPDGWWDENRQQAFPLADYPLTKKVLVEHSARQVNTTDAYADPAELAYMQKANVKSLLMMPTIFQDRAVGLVKIMDRSERLLTEQEIGLAQLLAQQAVIAIENARLYEQARREIEERLRAEEQIRTALKEKELLLKEIHHRVKNNLQIISSMLNLQLDRVNDRHIRDIFQDSRHRVRSMALIHEKLYRSNNLARVDLADYIRDLASYLLRSYPVSTSMITPIIDVEQVFLGIDEAVPSGLILNELISNALKHAFPPHRERLNGQKGEVRIKLRAEENQQVVLTVSDNGIGFPSDLDVCKTDSLGLRLVNVLVDQLDGTLEVHSGDGTQFKITFTAA